MPQEPWESLPNLRYFRIKRIAAGMDRKTAIDPSHEPLSPEKIGTAPDDG